MLKMMNILALSFLMSLGCHAQDDGTKYPPSRLQARVQDWIPHLDPTLIEEAPEEELNPPPAPPTKACRKNIVPRLSLKGKAKRSKKKNRGPQLPPISSINYQDLLDLDLLDLDFLNLD